MGYLKNGLLIWNIVLTAAVGFLIVSHFKWKDKSAESKVSIAKPDMVAANGAKVPFRIAYFEMDSIAGSLYMVRDLKDEMARRQEANDHELEELKRGFQQKFNSYQ